MKDNKLQTPRPDANELAVLIDSWAIDKGLDKADPHKQYLKVAEEAGEIAAGLARSDREKIMDGIGDTNVTLRALALTLGTTLEECTELAYNEIKHRTGKMVDGIFVKSSDL